jgi:hypothetical protein
MREYIKGVGVIAFISVAVLIVKLHQNTLPEPFSFEKILSKENIFDTLIGLFIASIIVVPLKLLWDWINKQKQNKL